MVGPPGKVDTPGRVGRPEGTLQRRAFQVVSVDATASASPSLMSTVPQHIMEASRRRILVIGLVGVVLATLEVLTAILGGTVRSVLWSATPTLALTIVLTLVANARRLPTRDALRYGTLILVAMTLVFGVLGGVSRYELGHPSMAGTWATVFMMMVPMVIPMTSRQSALALFVCGLGAPGGLWFAASLTDYVPSSGDFFAVIRTTTFVGLISFFASRSVHRAEQTVAPSQQLGSYRMRERIGAGGMGEVWAAEHALFGRPAAVKLLGGDAGEELTPALQAALFEEASMLAALTSPHTVNLFDFGVAEDGRVFFAMEWLDGLDLDALVRKHGPCEPARVVRILQQILLSLAEAHHNGVIHGDIKPANVVVCRVGVQHDFVKVLDFGLARRLDRDVVGMSQGLAQIDAGTPAFMAPETALDGFATPRSDLYSVGSVGYWLLTGRRLFGEDGSSSAAIAQLMQRPPAPTQVRPDLHIPEDLETIIMRALLKNPSERYRSAEEFRAALSTVACAGDWTEDRARQWWHEHGSAEHAPIAAAAPTPR